LPVTFPRTTGQLPLYYNYKPSGRIDDYVDQSGEATFPFGHGLSYTTFEYSNLRIFPEQIKPDGITTITLDVTNTGDYSGDEVVQVYVHDVLASVVRPVKELKAFMRITVKPQEVRTISFLLHASDLGLYDARLNYVVEPGMVDILVGSSAEDIRLQGQLMVTD
jgi:beta-glucosidase